MTTETTASKRSGILFSKADREEYRGNINWEGHSVTAAATAVDTNKADNALLEFGMLIGSSEEHKNQRTNMIRVSLFPGNSSEAQSNIQENEEVGGVRQPIPEVCASSLV